MKEKAIFLFSCFAFIVIILFVVDKWFEKTETCMGNGFSFPNEINAKDLGLFSRVNFRELDPSGVTWKAINYNYNRFVSSSSFNSENTLSSAINARLYCTSNEFFIVTTEDYEIGSMRVVRMNRKTGEIYNPTTRKWGYYGFVNDEQINEIKSFAQNMTLQEIVNKIGEPNWLYFSEVGRLVLQYFTESGILTIVLKNGYFMEYTIQAIISGEPP